MRRTNTAAFLIAAVALAAGGLMTRALAGCTGCTGGCRECVPACHGTWHEKESSEPVYSMKREYACTRGRDSWHAPPPGCRCRPPCGEVIVKKRCYKTDGPKHVERVPKYEVRMVPVEPAGGCDPCRPEGRLCWWNPLASLHRCTSWW